jgi:hypothetical protein
MSVGSIVLSKMERIEWGNMILILRGGLEMEDCIQSQKLEEWRGFRVRRWVLV